jgi:tRNA pseudouridine38-40 synthase
MGQVVHFDSFAKRPIHAWIRGTNTYLPPQVVVRWAKEVDDYFHARFTAIARRYQYIIFNHPIRSALLNQRASWVYYSLDDVKMHEAAQYLLGEQDFSSFRSSQCQSLSPMRYVHHCQVRRQGDFVIIDIQANAFLHHMVRNIVGVLLEIGSGKKQPTWIQEVLQAKNRQAAAETASPDGLYLTQVIYPDPYIFPIPRPLFLI